MSKKTAATTRPATIPTTSSSSRRTKPATIGNPIPTEVASQLSTPDQTVLDTQHATVGNGPILQDDELYLIAAQLDNIEAARIAASNRLRQATRSVEDKDGHLRGLGLDADSPVVLFNQQLIDNLDSIEKEVDKNLTLVMKDHPLHPWMVSPERKGVGAKQFVRLLASIGDPYWSSLAGGPRTVSQLWAYCGLHTLPVGQATPDTQPSSADSDQPNHSALDTQPSDVWLAAKRQRGQKANWSKDAKMRAFNIAKKCMMVGAASDATDASHYRQVYDKRRDNTAGRVHARDCVRCGPSGKPAKAGTPWSKAHQMADALRIMSKEILKDLWVESRRLHADDSTPLSMPKNGASRP